MEPIIKYLPRAKMYPKFGEAIYPNTVHIRADLPDDVMEFTKEHETYHLFDKSKNNLWRELKANAHAMCLEPWGGFLTFWMSVFSWKRWKLYFQRMRDNK